MNSIIAVNDCADVAGRIVYATFQGSVNINKIINSFIKNNIPLNCIPTPPSDDQVLKKVLKEMSVHTNDRTLIRPLDRNVCGYAMVNETASGIILKYSTVLTVELRHVNGQGTLHVNPSQYRDDVVAAYNQHTDMIDSSAYSAWLWQRMMPIMHATVLRSRGGVYFVPRPKLEFLKQVVSVTHDVTGHTIYQIPALNSEEAVRAVLTALTNEADTSIQKLTKNLQEYREGDKKVTAKIITNKTKQCDALLMKLEAYKDFLGKKLETITEKVEDMQIQYSQLSLMSFDDEGKK